MVIPALVADSALGSEVGAVVEGASHSCRSEYVLASAVVVCPWRACERDWVWSTLRSSYVEPLQIERYSSHKALHWYKYVCSLLSVSSVGSSALGKHVKFVRALLKGWHSGLGGRRSLPARDPHVSQLGYDVCTLRGLGGQGGSDITAQINEGSYSCPSLVGWGLVVQGRVRDGGCRLHRGEGRWLPYMLSHSIY